MCAELVHGRRELEAALETLWRYAFDQIVTDQLTEAPTDEFWPPCIICGEPAENGYTCHGHD